MVEHVEQAQLAGIDGFIVSWKHRDDLDQRLATLTEIADERGFSLWVIYQGLDVARDPLPVPRIATDLQWFADTYGAHPVYTRFGPPVVIWSGTWRFSPEEISAAAEPVRDRLRVLASERKVDDLARLRGRVDGNAYYWSSVDPVSHPGYDQKLQEMGAAVHDDGGLWVAPAAPGFDARLVGGTRVVDRADGETLRRQWAAASHSAPDAIGIISWNEFSENSHIEPSRNHGNPVPAGGAGPDRVTGSWHRELLLRRARRARWSHRRRRHGWRRALHGHHHPGPLATVSPRPATLIRPPVRGDPS
jgi:hypothetical protein